MLRMTVVSSLVALFACAVWAVESPTPNSLAQSSETQPTETQPSEAHSPDAQSPDAQSPEALTAEVEGLKAAGVAWREISWKSCLLDGLKESREKQRPVLLWIFIDRPADDARC